MIETLQFTEEGEKLIYDNVIVYALSTCGFCKMAIAFLLKHNIKFRYVYVDRLEADAKQELKKILSEKYKTNLGFPYMVINNSDVIVGFNEEEWKDIFSI